MGKTALPELVAFPEHNQPNMTDEQPSAVLRARAILKAHRQ